MLNLPLNCSSLNPISCMCFSFMHQLKKFKLNINYVHYIYLEGPAVMAANSHPTEKKNEEKPFVSFP